jgi:hypothetical protein
MTRLARSLSFVAAAPLLLLAVPARPDPTAEDVRALLQRQTQELVDALALGKTEVWDRYLDADLRYVDESGSVSTKKQMIESIKALPEGVSGSIRVTAFDVVLHGNVAVATYIDDEDENYHGQKLHCQYRTTDTWLRKPEGWRLIAGQVLALRTDPPSRALPAAMREQYCGTYTLASGISYEIRCQEEALEGQQSGGRQAEPLLAEAPDVLFVPGKPRYRYIIERDAAGKVTSLIQRREAWDLVWKRES